MRAVFMGTPAIAVPALEALHAIAEIPFVVCQPDKPAGRGMVLTAPPVKVRALELGLEVRQPVKVRDGALAGFLRDARADVALVIAYGRILPRDVLDAPRVGCLNLHASLLPQLRGAAPITWAIVRGHRETGVGLMQMEEGLDTGPVFAELRLAIDPDETAGELGVRIGALAADLVRASLADAVEGRLVARPQDHAAATLAPILRKEDGRIDWSKPASAVHDHVRGMSPWPGASTTLADGRVLRILRTQRVETNTTMTEHAAGTIAVADKSGVFVACGAGVVGLLEAQLEGKRAMKAVDLVNGRVLSRGLRLG